MRLLDYMRVQSLWFCLSLTVLLSGCASTVMQAYSGEKLPDDRVAIIKSPYTGSILLSAARDVMVPGVRHETHFTRVDERDCDGFTPVVVLPGSHTLKVNIIRYVNGIVASAETSSSNIVEISFVAEPGRSYFVDGKMANEKPEVWITDETTGNVVAVYKE